MSDLPIYPIVRLGLRGEKLIKSYEKLRLTAYRPTPNDVLTIGYGSTKGVRPGMKITREQAEERFRADVSESIKAVESLARKMQTSPAVDSDYPLTESMTDALISLVFNVGASAVSSGNTIGRELIKGEYVNAWRGFALWTKQKGKDLLGLARRRGEEMRLFLEDGLP